MNFFSNGFEISAWKSPGRAQNNRFYYLGAQYFWYPEIKSPICLLIIIFRSFLYIGSKNGEDKKETS